MSAPYLSPGWPTHLTRDPHATAHRTGWGGCGGSSTRVTQISFFRRATARLETQGSRFFCGMGMLHGDN